MKKTSEVSFKEWVQQLKTDPAEAIPKTNKVYDTREKNDCDDVFLRSLAGGPSKAVTWPVYNALGSVYPDLTRSLKDQVLDQLLGIFDSINWEYVNGERGIGHTTGIREPLLLADIGIVRQIYWPGLDEGKKKIAKYKEFRKLKKDVITKDGMFNKNKVMSDFVLGYSLLRSDFCGYGAEYVRVAEFSFLERTLRGIVALRFGRSDTNTKQGVARLYELLPPVIHDRLEPLRREGGWADYTKFK